MNRVQKSTVSIIEQDMAIGAVKDILDSHGIRTPFGWEIVIGMLLDECESHLEVRGYRSSAVFVFH